MKKLQNKFYSDGIRHSCSSSQFSAGFLGKMFLAEVLLKPEQKIFSLCFPQTLTEQKLMRNIQQS